MRHGFFAHTKDGTITIRVVCAILFLLFSFCWLYWFQADVLAVAQHGLSGGKTHYSRLFGALIITGVLMLLQLIVYAIVRLARRTHAMTYLPSFLLLAFLSSLSHPFRWGAWLWAGPLVLVLWIGVVILSRKMLPFNHDEKLNTGLLSRRSWVNVVQMAVMMLMVAAVANTNAVDHFKAHAEVALMEGDADEALRVGSRSLESDASLTMLRMAALSQRGQLGERLFEYPVTGSSRDMLPLPGSRSQLLLMPDTLLWNLFGVHPDSIVARAEAQGHAAGIFGGHLSVSQYLDSLAADTLATPAYRDYQLAGLLIDRQLDAFAACLPSYYAIDTASLPRHYREALVLYQQRCDTSYIYKDSTMLLRWHDYLRYHSAYSRKSERIIRSEEDFRDTYWYYYYQ